MTSEIETAKRGRALLIPWARIPWWVVIILIVGATASYLMLTRTAYQDVIQFLLGLPWNKEQVAIAERQEDDTWKFKSSVLSPGDYRLYGEFMDEAGRPVGCTETHLLQVPKEAEGVLIEPLPSPPVSAMEEKIVVLIQEATDTAGEEVDEIHFYDSLTLLETLHKMWASDGVSLTIKTTLSAFALALGLGLIGGLGRVSKNPILYAVATLYVEVIRGLPMLVIILYMGFVIGPWIRDATSGTFDPPMLQRAVAGLGFGYGAYLTEVYRAGIQSVHRGQMEAARSLGMSYFQAMRYVILPQAFRVILPPLVNDLSALLKDSSLISVIALADLLQMGRLYASRTFRAFEPYNTVALLYLVMTITLSSLSRVLERRMRIGE
jgi:polar amino acid transport system permease protein